MKIFTDELGRLAQGTLYIPGTDKIWFIRRSVVPKGCTVTYGRISIKYIPQKKDPNRTILTVGG